jgi:hypothetical protein
MDNISANKSDNTTSASDHAPHHNALADAINAVQTALGVNLGNVALVGAPASAAAAAVTAHEAAADPHPQYTTAAEAAAAAPVQSVAGRTGTVTLAKSDVGLSNVDNTSDANKPVSTATETALNAKLDRTFADAALTYAATVNLDMAALAGLYRTLTLTGNVTFTTSNRAAGRAVVIRLLPGASPRTLNFPPGWVFLSAVPTTLAANKTAVLSVTFFGAADTDAVVAYAVQP